MSKGTECGVAGEKIVELRTPLTMNMLALTIGFAENAAKAFGLEAAQSLRLALAVEEVFAFLAARGQGEAVMRLLVRSGGYYVEIVCFVPLHALPTRVMNQTVAANPEDEDFLAEMGILLAARMVDRFRLALENEQEMGLCFLVEKEYPEMRAQLAAPPAGNYRPGKGGRDELKRFAQQAGAFYRNEAPDFFRFPGKVLDMVAGGEYEAVLAVDGKGNVGGGMLWTRRGSLVEAYGPYVFREGLAVGIVEKVLENLSRSQAVSMVIRRPTIDVPRDYFEELGCLTDSAAGTGGVLYRQLEEDTGMTAFVHVSLQEFVTEYYERFVLPRDIIAVESAGERQAEHCVLSVTVDAGAKQAVLAAQVAGADAPAVLQDYLTSLQRQHMAAILFELDMGREEEALLVPALTAAGFAPLFVLPCGGKGDLIVFQYGGGN